MEVREVKEIKANTQVTFDIIETSEEYMRLGICYIIFGVLALGMYFLIVDAPLIILIAGISFAIAVYMFVVSKKMGNKMFKLDNCYIKLTDSDRYLECRQLVDGKYEYMKISLAEIGKLMEVDEGVQIWLEEGAHSNLFIVDDESVNRSVACINCYAYDIEEFKAWYVTFSAYLPDDIEAYRDGQQWGNPTKKDDTVKMMIPCALYLIPLVISVVLMFV